MESVAFIPMSPRIAVEIIDFGDISCAVLVAHAPIGGAEKADKDCFWNMIIEASRRSVSMYHADFLVMLIDANARTGSNLSASIDPCHPATEDDNGCRLRLFLDECQMAALNTFSGGGNTWTSPSGHSSRIDYVCTSRWVLPYVTAVNVINNLHISPSDLTDHLAVFADIDVVAASENVREANSKKPKRPQNFSSRALYCPTKLACPLRRQSFQTAVAECGKQVSAMPCDSASDIDAKVAAWYEAMLDHAQRLFAPEKMGRPVKKWMSEQSWSIVLMIAPIRRLHFKAIVAQRSFVLKCIWIAWHSVKTHDCPLPDCYVNIMQSRMQSFNRAAAV